MASMPHWYGSPVKSVYNPLIYKENGGEDVRHIRSEYILSY